MFGLAAISHSLIFALIGPKWEPSVVYLQMMCFVGLLYPLNSLNINLLNVVGRSDLYLKLQLISQVFTIPAIVLGVIYGIKILILGLCLNSLFAYIYFSKVSSAFSGYKLSTQFKDMLTPVLLAGFMGAVVYLIDYLMIANPLLTLITQFSAGIIIVIALSEFFRIKEYLFLKEIIVSQLKKLFLKL